MPSEEQYSKNYHLYVHNSTHLNTKTLNLQLLRFVYDTKQGKKCKVADDIDFPHELDLTPWVKEFKPTEQAKGSQEKKTEGFSLDPVAAECTPGNDEHKYQLVAVLLHLGATPFGGHYIAHIKSRFVLDIESFLVLLVPSNGPHLMIKP